MLKKILIINLNKETYEAKTISEISEYIGGVGLGFKLLLDHLDKDPIIFSVGPLNGFFPFVSKTSVVFHTGTGPEDLYFGGSLSSRMKFAGIDSLIIEGKANEPVLIDIINEEVKFRSIDSDPDSLGLPGKRSVIRPIVDKYTLDGYFETPENLFESKINKKNVRGIVITGTKTHEIYDKERYSELYMKILSRFHELKIEKSTAPSCVGCPMGCEKSRVGEMGGNVLVHSLTACNFAEDIYSNIGVVFSCLNVLGYDYTHEDIEKLPSLIEDTLKELTL